MGYLTPQQKADLLALIEANGLTGEPDNDVVANTLSAATTVAVPGASVPKPFTWEQLMGCFTPAEALTLQNMPAITVIVAQVNAQDRAALVRWVNGFAYSGAIGVESAGKALAVLNATETTPDSTAPGPSPFEQAFPDFYHKVDGVGYTRCTAALIAEARA